MNARTPVLQIKTSLRRTWQGFFGRFGRLLPIQIAAIPPILARRNVIISAPTAAGKTEAVVAPLAERLLADGAPSVGILYIAPTRALVNDVERRLAGPCATADLSVAVRTGDRRELRLKSQPHVLITTPESTDSMLCRIPQVFRDTRAIVLDEVHQLDGNYRGDQMRVLLRRLERISGRQQHIIALRDVARCPGSRRPLHDRSRSVPSRASAGDRTATDGHGGRSSGVVAATETSQSAPVLQPEEGR